MSWDALSNVTDFEGPATAFWLIVVDWTAIVRATVNFSFFLSRAEDSSSFFRLVPIYENYLSGLQGSTGEIATGALNGWYSGSFRLCTSTHSVGEHTPRNDVAISFINFSHPPGGPSIPHTVYKSGPQRRRTSPPRAQCWHNTCSEETHWGLPRRVSHYIVFIYRF